MGSGISSIGVGALQNAQLGLATTSHNIANAKTDGYSRQRIILASNTALPTVSGYVGTGAHVSTIERIYSRFITTQVNGAQARVSSLEAYSSEITQLNDLLFDSDTGLTSALDSLFTGIQQVSSGPSSLTTRQTMVSAAQTLVSRFQMLDEVVDDQYATLNGRIDDQVSSINTYSGQIASLNKQIIVAESSNGQPPNDLYDQRDQLVAKLNELIGAKTTVNGDGSYNVYFGNGQELVAGAHMTKLTAMNSSADPSRRVVGLSTAAGDIELPQSLIKGGSLGGILEYRSGFLDGAAGKLDQLASTFASTFNDQHALGQDLLGSIDGEAGFVGQFFTIGDAHDAAGTIAVNPAIVADVRRIAAAAPIRTSATSSNTGGATISAGSVAAGYAAPASGSQLIFTYNAGSLAVSLKDSAGNITAGSPATVPFTSGDSITYDGMSFTITGAPANGDSFVIQRNTGGVSDNRNMLLLGQLQTAKTMAGNTASYSTFYSQLVSEAGNKGSEVETLLAAQTSLLDQAQSARESLSGVNLDEEAANLLQYQQSYQAAAKMLEVASKLFDSILAIG